MHNSTYPDAAPDYLTAQHIKDAIVMWIEDQKPNGDEMVDLSMFVHKQIFEAFGGSVEETGETFIDDAQIIDVVEGNESERLALAKIFKFMCKDMRDDVPKFEHRNALMIELETQWSDLYNSSSSETRSIIRRSMINLILLDELRYDNEN